MPIRAFLATSFALAALAVPPAAASQDSGGAMLYRQRCQSCHALQPGAASPMGPNLAGVVGRKAGASDYRYSPALKAADIIWTRESLDSYLAGPMRMVPGTRMAIAVSDAGHRAELINYLEARR
jgi:cytochrome c